MLGLSIFAVGISAIRGGFTKFGKDSASRQRGRKHGKSFRRALPGLVDRVNPGLHRRMPCGAGIRISSSCLTKLISSSG